VEGAKELADPLLRVAHARLERLGDLVKQQEPPRPLGRHGLDPAVTEENAQPRVAGQRLENRRRVKAGQRIEAWRWIRVRHDSSVRPPTSPGAEAFALPGPGHLQAFWKTGMSIPPIERFLARLGADGQYWR